MKFDLSKIQFSRNDIKRGITIPTKLTEEVAEFIGIMVGDGHVGKHGTHYELYISGNMKDYEHHAIFVNNLIERLFNIKFRVKIRKRNEVCLRRDSKAILCFLRNVVGIPQRKSNIKIPKCIVKANPKIKAAFIRGLADSDFTLTVKNKEGIKYPVVQGAAKSEELMKGICIILDELEINHCTIREKKYYKKRDVTYEISVVFVNGRKNINDWFARIGFSNPRHLKKYKEYLKYWEERKQ